MQDTHVLVAYLDEDTKIKKKKSGQQTVYNSGNTNGKVAENGKMLNHE